MEGDSERERPWTTEDKERFLDRIGGYELEAGELSEEEIQDFLDLLKKGGLR